jgi:hypothetical protein
MARHQFVRRLESERFDRARDGRTLLRAAVHARTKPGANTLNEGETKTLDLRLVTGL